jgi:hypothetical protein
MKKFFYYFLISIFFLSLLGCYFLKKNEIKTEFSEYINNEIKISLQYPSNWKPDEKVAYLGKQPSRYFGSDGFFAVNVISSDDLTLEAIAEKEAQSGDYGQNPQTKRLIHNAKIGYLIIPSADQTKDEKQRGCFITELRNRYRSNQINYDIIILFADQAHLMNLLETLEN